MKTKPPLKKQPSLETHALSVGIVFTDISLKPGTSLEQMKDALTAGARLARTHFLQALKSGTVRKP